MHLNLPDEATTQALGARIAEFLLPCARGVVYLRGDLGAGKTTLARALLRRAGLTCTLRSPTYTLMEPYRSGDVAFLHLDLYRLSDPSEVEQLGLRDFAPESTIWLVEWPERGGALLPPADLDVELRQAAEGRSALLTGPLAARLGAP